MIYFKIAKWHSLIQNTQIIPKTNFPDQEPVQVQLERKQLKENQSQVNYTLQLNLDQVKLSV